MSELSELLKARTMKFCLDVCCILRNIPESEPGLTAKRQLARSATGVAFDYRASCRARSHDEFTAKIGIVAEESDETQGWLEFIEASELLKSEELTRLIVESTEIVAIMSSAYGTAKYNQRNRRPDDRRKRK